MNLDPILKNLGKYFSNNQDSTEEEISSLEHVFKREFREDPNSDEKELLPGKLRKIGDLNNDGKVDIDDVLALKDVLEGKRHLDEKELYYADLNQDGVVDYKDLNLMINVVFESRKAEEKVIELQGVYDELTMKQEHGLTSSNIDKVRIDTVKSELEHAIADFILQNHDLN